MIRNARQWQNPLRRRRAGDGLIVAAALLAGAAARWGDLWLWLAALLIGLAGVVLEARTSDGLLTYRFPGTRRRSFIIAAGGLAAIVAGLVLGFWTPKGVQAALLVGGAGFLLGGGGALAWHHGATYAGDRIVRLSDEEW
jgi:drug/metabolite transporter (DMT)-like permease